MSVHPNVMLMAHLSPQDMPRKTYLEIIGESVPDDPQVEIGGDKYNVVLMDGYDEGWQMDADPGEIVLLGLVTYGYGERIEWAELQRKAEALIAWVIEHAAQYGLDPVPRISVGANYW